MDIRKSHQLSHVKKEKGKRKVEWCIRKCSCALILYDIVLVLSFVLIPGELMVVGEKEKEKKRGTHK